MLSRKPRRITKDELENAMQAMSETAKSWEARCHAIMAALNLDYGGFSTEVPDEGSWFAVNNRRQEQRIFDLVAANDELRRQLQNH